MDTYRSSGKFSLVAVPIALVGGALAAGIGFLYTLIITWIPLIYLNVLATLGFAVAAGAIAAFASTTGKVRNTFLGMVLGLLVGVSALAGGYYFSYQQWLSEVEDALAEQEGVQDEAAREKLLAELTFKDYIDNRVEYGWTIGRVTSSSGGGLSGFFVWLFWGIEGLVIAGGGVIGGMASATSAFCEHCEAWTEGEKTVRNYAADDAEVSRVKSAADVGALLDPIPEPEAPTCRIQYSLEKCGTCDQSNYLTIHEVRVVMEKVKGKEQEKNVKTRLHFMLTLTAEQTAKLAPEPV